MTRRRPGALRALVLLALAAGLACAGAGRQPQTHAERLEFERDSDRCRLQTERLVGVVDPGEYRACMRARGWSAPPPE